MSVFFNYSQISDPVAGLEASELSPCQPCLLQTSCLPLIILIYYFCSSFDALHSLCMMAVYDV